MRIEQLRILTIVVTIMMAIGALPLIALNIWASALPDHYAMIAELNLSTIEYSIAAYTLLTMVVFSRWIYVAGTNAIALGHDDLEFTPGERIWWFVVPFFNLYKPFQGMRELWNASHGQTQAGRNHELVTIWWIFWLIGSFFSLIATLIWGQNESAVVTISWIESVLNIVCAVTASALVVKIYLAQRRPARSDFAQIFE